MWWPFGIKLMRALTNLLFFPGLTISSEISFQEKELKAPSQKILAFPIPFNEKILWYPFEGQVISKPTKLISSTR